MKNSLEHDGRNSMKLYTSESSEYAARPKKTIAFNQYFLKHTANNLVKSYIPAWWNFNPHFAVVYGQFVSEKHKPNID